MVVDALAGAHSIRVTRKENMALVGLGAVAGQRVIVAKPQTYMNLSGPSVKGLLDKYTLTAANLIVVYDEMDLPWTAVRIKKSGSAAGHNGIKSLIGALGTDDFVRVRMGIDPAPDGGRAHRGSSLVLGTFRPGQAKDVE